jgi:hypothetical protein
VALDAGCNRAAEWKHVFHTDAQNIVSMPRWVHVLLTHSALQQCRGRGRAHHFQASQRSLPFVATDRKCDSIVWGSCNVRAVRKRPGRPRGQDSTAVQGRLFDALDCTA